MASWRTCNKRARRVQAREQAAKHVTDEMIRAAMIAAFEDACKKLADNIVANFASAMRRLADSMRMFTETDHQAWGPLDPKYARPRREVWPDVVYEDVLDAEFIE